jgi:AbrB family looped-hinge helix DNA binding protein
MDISTLTEKGQATVPAPIRKKLGLRPGDRIMFYELASGEIAIRPLPKADQDWARFIAHTLKDELHSAADDDAYGNL